MEASQIKIAKINASYVMNCLIWDFLPHWDLFFFTKYLAAIEKESGN